MRNVLYCVENGVHNAQSLFEVVDRPSKPSGIPYTMIISSISLGSLTRLMSLDIYERKRKEREAGGWWLVPERGLVSEAWIGSYSYLCSLHFLV